MRVQILIQKTMERVNKHKLVISMMIKVKIMIKSQIVMETEIEIRMISLGILITFFLFRMKHLNQEQKIKIYLKIIDWMK